MFFSDKQRPVNMSKRNKIKDFCRKFGKIVSKLLHCLVLLEENNIK